MEFGSTMVENLVFQTGFEDASILVQYLLFGSIQPTAYHWSFHSDEERLRPLAEIRQTSTLIFPISGNFPSDEEGFVSLQFDIVLMD